jgi:hypothetical protein
MATRPRHGHDPLSEAPAAKAIAGAAIATLLLAAAISATTPVPADLPGIALGSPTLLHLERALLAGAVVVVVLMFLVRGWAGYYPSKVSATGAEYPSLLALEQSAKSSNKIAEALAALQTQHDEFAELTTRDIAALRDAIGDTTPPE